MQPKKRKRNYLLILFCIHLEIINWKCGPCRAAKSIVKLSPWLKRKTGTNKWKFKLTRRMANATSSTSSEPWPNRKSEYIINDLICIGSSAYVYSGYCVQRDKKCAIKVIDISKCNSQELEKEFEILTEYNHKNVVSYYTSFIVNDALWLILSLVEGGSLRDIIDHKLATSQCVNGVFNDATIATVLKEVLKGLEYLNSKGQCHRDLKASHILVGSNGAVVITDFGVTAWLSSGRDMSKQSESGDFVGSSYWMAPEVMDVDAITDCKVDIWSVGITAIEMATGHPPYYKLSPMQVIKATLQDNPPTLETGAPEGHRYHAYGKIFRGFITACLKKNPTRRPDASELLQHPFLKKAQDDKYLTQTICAIGPSYESRVKKAVKFDLGASGRLHRTMSHEWVWSESELYQIHQATGKQSDVPTTLSENKTTDSKRRSLVIKKAWSSLGKKVRRLRSVTDHEVDESAAVSLEDISQQTSDPKDLPTEDKLIQRPLTDSVTRKPMSKIESPRLFRKGQLMQGLRDVLSVKPVSQLMKTTPKDLSQIDIQMERLNLGEELVGQKTSEKKWDTKVPGDVQKDLGIVTQKLVDITPSTSCGGDLRTIQVVYRVRNENLELNDIHITFDPESETPESLAGEMVQAGLLDPRDTVLLATNLARLLQQPIIYPSRNTIKFHLNSTGPNEEYNEKNLIGFAQLSISK